MKPDVPHILLVNPWIHDFAAYDFWAKPLGLLTLAAILRSHGLRVTYVDCLDRFHVRGPSAIPHRRQGRGPYLKTPIPNPPGLENIPRTYCRYGIKAEWLGEDLQLAGVPDLILVTSAMTYWYPGVQATIAAIRAVYPNAPLCLGGTYATLCRDHAEALSGVDRIMTGPGEPVLLDLVKETTGFDPAPRFDPHDLDTYPWPAFDLQSRIPYVPLLTSRGCPFNCTYCASHYLHPKLMRRDPAAVVEEIRFWHTEHGVIDYVLYDDAFLVEREQHAFPILEGLCEARLNIRLHTPNAIHIRGLTERLVRLMFSAGFKTIRLGLETTAFEGRAGLDNKVTAEEFQRGVGWLKAAGFRGEQIGAYLLVGLPGQPRAAVEASIAMVKACGIRPVPAYYTPIPHTALWEKAKQSSRYDLAADPIFCNNAILPCQKEAFAWSDLSRIKHLASTP
jgi:hypothetical protein